jgi:hypothetical protein
MKKKIIITIVISCVVVIGGFIIYMFFNQGAFFSSEGRYDDTELNYMGVIFENSSDINSFNEGYSTSSACPWGFEHDGIDFFFNNDSNVIAAAPGKVWDISNYIGEGENKYHVKLKIRFSNSILLSYGFEPWTDNTSARDKQWDILQVEIGDWVQKGDVLAQFLQCNESAHIHFDITENNQKHCPTKYYSSEGYAQMIDLIHFYHSTWELCYP